eukprot:gene34166-biopygen17779
MDCWLQDEKDPPNVEDLGEHFYSSHNTVKGDFLLLSKRYTLIHLHATIESDATVHNGAEALRMKMALQAKMEKVYAGTKGLVTNSVLSKWLKEIDTTKAKAMMNRPARRGARVNWIDKAPLLFDHMIYIAADATPRQLEWMEAETASEVSTHKRMGAGKKEATCLPPFLVPKPKTSKWRLVMDFRRLNAHCMKSRYKMETLKKHRRLAKLDDWCFSFDLQDGERKVQCQPTLLVEHFRLEANLKAEDFRMTLARLQKIHQQAHAHLNEASQERSTWNGRHNWHSPARAKLHTDSSLFLVAMLFHFTSRNPELTWRMRRLWVLLDLNDIELQARYLRSEANEWGDRLSTED